MVAGLMESACSHLRRPRRNRKREWQGCGYMVPRVILVLADVQPKNYPLGNGNIQQPRFCSGVMPLLCNCNCISKVLNRKLLTVNRMRLSVPKTIFILLAVTLGVQSITETAFATEMSDPLICFPHHILHHPIDYYR